jgi:hypothetical protein
MDTTEKKVIITMSPELSGGTHYVLSTPRGVTLSSGWTKGGTRQAKQSGLDAARSMGFADCQVKP